MKKFNVLQMSLLVLVFTLLVNSGSALANPTGAEILARLDQEMSAKAKVMTQKMTLVAAGGQERSRELQTWNKRGPGGDQMLARFLSPADVKGTGILMSDDDMWLYLPALGKVRRVAGHAKKGSFMGSDLSYDDMEQLGAKGFAASYDPQILEEDGQSYALQLTPKGTEGDYSRLKMWIDKEVWLPRKIEYYDLAGGLLKILTTSDFKEVQGRVIAQKMLVEDEQKGTKTILEILDVSFDQEIDDSLFTTRNLERGM